MTCAAPLFCLGEFMRLFGTVNDSIVDGPGLRYVVFFQGCSHHCLGCHNPESHDPVGGEERSVESVMGEIRHNKILTGVTFSGGEPFEQAADAVALAREVKALGLNLWVYTGYTIEQLRTWDDADVQVLLSLVDVIVDGPFVLGKRSLSLRFRGSANQRIIDMHELQ